MAKDLGTFEGKKITKTTISVRNAGDGLSQAMHVDPQLLPQGEVVYVVMECVVGPVSFDPIKNSEKEVERKHALRAGAATIVDAKLVQQAVEAQTAIIVEAREKEKGIQQLPTDKKLLDAHNDGEHDKSPYIGCPICTPAKGAIPTAKPKPPTKAPVAKKAPAAKRTRKPSVKK